MHPLQLLKPIIGEGEGGERSLRVHHRRSMQLVEGEKEGREVGKVVKSHCAGQPVMGAIQVSESRKKCYRGAKLVQGAVG